MTKEEKIKEAQLRKAAIQQKIKQLHQQADNALENAKKAHQILDELEMEKKANQQKRNQ